MQIISNRRNFIRTTALAVAAVSATGIVTGCDTSWINTAIADIPTAISIADSISAIVTLATGTSIITPAIAAVIEVSATAIKAGLSELQTLINTYQSSKDTTTLGKIDDTLTQLASDLSGLLSQFSFADQNTKTVLTTAATLLLSVINALQLLVPPSATSLATHPFRRVAPAALKSKPVLPSKEQIQTLFNSTAVLTGYASVQV